MGWYCEDHVIFLRFVGKITADDLPAMDTFVVRCYESSPQVMVHMIVDVRDVTEHTPLRQTLRLRSLRHARRGWMMTVGALQHPVSRFVVGAITSMFKIRHRDADGVDEALDFLQGLNPGLPDLQPCRPALAQFYPEQALDKPAS
jgi:hypothetical protein